MRVSRVSVLGDFQQPLQVLCRLLDIKPIAKCFTALPRFLPMPFQNGRAIQVWHVSPVARSLPSAFIFHSALIPSLPYPHTYTHLPYL
jgi:hypothetical protein